MASNSQPQTTGHLITGLRAKLYDLRQPIWRYIRRGHLRGVELKPGQQLLDVGFGTGNTLAALYSRYGDKVQLYGVEPSEDMIAQAKKRLDAKTIHLQTATAEALPFKDGYFDYVVCNLVMHHLPFGTKRKGLKEVNRVLKPNGIFILSDWEKPTNTVGRLIAWKWRNHAYVSENTKGPFLKLLKEAGFKDVETISVQAGVVHHFRSKK